MGVIWYVYCPTHKEILDIGKWWHLSRVGKFTREDIQRVQSELSRVRPDRGPNETLSDDRILALVTAFLERHAGCGARVINDWEKTFETEIGEFTSGWKTFDVDDDGPLQGYYRLARAEELRRYLEKWTPKVEEARNRLGDRSAYVWRRRRLAGWISDMEERLRHAQKEIGEIESQPTPTDRNPEQSERAQKVLARMDTDVRVSVREEIRRLEKGLDHGWLWPWKRRKIMKDLANLQSGVSHLAEYTAAERSGPWALGHYVDMLQMIRETPLSGKP